MISKLKTKLTALAFIIMTPQVYAESVLSKNLEEEIAKQSGLKYVVTSQNALLECQTCSFNNLKIDPKNQSFSVTIATNDEDKTITGNYYEAIMLPVITSRISKNDLISDEKISYKKLRNNRKYDDYFFEKEEIVGNVAMRNLTIGFPINKRDVAKGELIKRNSEVKIVYSKGAISLESIGQAISEGGIGSKIKVKNLESGKILTGKIIDSRTVRIGE